MVNKTDEKGPPGLTSSSTPRPPTDEDKSPQRKRLRSTEKEDEAGFSSWDSDSDDSDSTPEDPNSQTIQEIQDLADDLDENSVKLADFLMARLSARDKHRDKMVSKIAERQKKGLKKITTLVQEATDMSATALSTAKEAASKADGAIAMVIEVRDNANQEISSIRADVEEQGKQIAHLHQLLKTRSSAPSSPVQRRVQKPGDRIRSIQAGFQDLMDQAALLERSFVMGKKKDEQVDATVTDAVTALAKFFPGMKVSVTQAPKAKTVRLHVDTKEDAKFISTAIDSRWAEFAQLGWWIREDSPIELRMLENRARDFILAAKNSDPSVKAAIGFVTVKQGRILKDGCDVLPLCFIPAMNGDNWERLFTPLAERVKSLQGQDWLGQFTVDDTGFYLQWFKLAGLPQLAADYQAYAARVKSAAN